MRTKLISTTLLTVSAASIILVGQPALPQNTTDADSSRIVHCSSKEAQRSMSQPEGSIQRGILDNEVDPQDVLPREKAMKCGAIVATTVSRKLRGFAVNVSSSRSHLETGQNELCIEFKTLAEGLPVNPEMLQVEATLTLGHVKAVLAIVHLSSCVIGCYCGRVKFPWPGSWLITVRYGGHSGKGKVVLQAQVT